MMSFSDLMRVVYTRSYSIIQDECSETAPGGRLIEVLELGTMSPGLHSNFIAVLIQQKVHSFHPDVFPRCHNGGANSTNDYH